MSLPDKTSSEAGANIGQRAEGNTNIYEALDAQCRVKLCGARQYKQDGAWCMVLCACACGAMTYNLEASLGAHLILEPHIFLKGALIIYAQYSVMGEEKFHYQWVGVIGHLSVASPWWTLLKYPYSFLILLVYLHYPPLSFVKTSNANKATKWWILQSRKAWNYTAKVIVHWECWKMQKFLKTSCPSSQNSSWPTPFSPAWGWPNLACKFGQIPAQLCLIQLLPATGDRTNLCGQFTAWRLLLLGFMQTVMQPYHSTQLVCKDNFEDFYAKKFSFYDIGRLTYG